jgi:nodulation protein E
MPARRVAVTGLGAVSALGDSAPEFWEALKGGRSGIAPIIGIDAEQLRFKNAAQARGFDAAVHFDPDKLSLLDRFAQFALVSARECVRDARIEWTDTLRARAAIVTGSCIGGQDSQDAGFREIYWERRSRVHPLTIPRTMANAGAGHISMEFGISGPALTISTACSSSNHAIGLAFQMVRDGRAELALAGGSEAPFSMGLLKSWEAMRVVSPDTCRPFCRDRRGLILGEGGAMLVLEPLDAARMRGTRIYAEVAGFGMSSDAHHVTQPSADGPARAMQLALEDGGLHPEQIAYINAHGTGTPANDPIETRAIHQVFGSYASTLACSSTKSMHGHALGAAGALEAVATVMALHDGILPPTANFTEADAECDLDYIPNQARHAPVECALSSSFAFGGLNAVLAFRSLPD